MITISVANKRNLLLYFVLIFIGTTYLQIYTNFLKHPEAEFTFFMIVFWVLTLLVKLKVEENKNEK